MLCLFVLFVKMCRVKKLSIYLKSILVVAFQFLEYNEKLKSTKIEQIHRQKKIGPFWLLLIMHNIIIFLEATLVHFKMRKIELCYRYLF